jgi:beta-glucosidase
MAKKHFPKDFLWGASTSSHQVEGGTNSQWDEWERLKAGKLPVQTQKLLGRLDSWPDIQAQANDPDNYIAGDAVQHYLRYKEDFKLLTKLNMNAFRFSLEWSRIEPEQGKFDEAAIRHYREYILELKRLGIEPFMTLWHFTNPVWFEKKGGWERRENVHLFEQYVTRVADEFGDLVKFVSPLNEPNTYVTISYILGLWPPQKHKLFLAWKVYKHLIRAHEKAYIILKQHNPKVQVGTAMAMGNDLPVSKFFLSRLVAFVWQRLFNWWLLDTQRKTHDFIGLNYYLTNYYGWYGRFQNPPKPLNDLGWYMEPKAIGRLLKLVHFRYRKPIYVTENGLADREDAYRTWWIQETIIAMQDAIDEGVDLRGYMHWSLLDNFEWAFGWLAQFGLVHVDRKTMERTLRPSAKWFGEQIKEMRGLDVIKNREKG